MHPKNTALTNKAPPIKIGINAHFLTRLPRRGIGTYGLHLIQEMTAAYPDIDFYLYIRHPDTESILPDRNNVFVRILPVPFDPLWEQLALPIAAYKDGVNLLHSIGNTGPVYKSGSIKYVLTIHDVMFLQSGDFVSKPATLYQRVGRLYRAFVTPKCACNSDAIITVSEFSRQDILALIPRLKTHHITVTYEGCDPIFSETSKQLNCKDFAFDKYNVIKPYIFCLGADDPRKNTLRLVNAYLKLVQEKGIEEMLVICGYRGWENSPAYKEVLRVGAGNRVKFLPFVSMEELRSLYQQALLFIYPSLYEGFGIPILEAFTVGCPVIASNVTSLPEIGGDAVLYCDPKSTDNLTQTIDALIYDPVLRKTLVERGHIRASKFNWGQVAAKTIDIYRECLSSTD